MSFSRRRRYSPGSHPSSRGASPRPAADEPHSGAARTAHDHAPRPNLQGRERNGTPTFGERHAPRSNGEAQNAPKPSHGQHAPKRRRFDDGPARDGDGRDPSATRSNGHAGRNARHVTNRPNGDARSPQNGNARRVTNKPDGDARNAPNGNARRVTNRPDGDARNPQNGNARPSAKRSNGDPRNAPNGNARRVTNRPNGGARSPQNGNARHVANRPNGDVRHGASERPTEAPEIIAPVETFDALELSAPLLRAIREEGYGTPTPIQARAIPQVLRQHDLLACAQTGTGKTAAFVLPILHLLSNRQGPARIRALVLTPTRELAAQIAERSSAYGRYLRLRSTVVYGGVSQSRQERELKRQPELLIATPGRLLDLMSQRVISLDAVEILVLDEADRMLDMGFLPAVRRIVDAVPRERQTLFFSATMAGEIERLANSILRSPKRVSVAPAATTADTVEQMVIHVEKPDKRTLLGEVLRRENIDRALVFARTKHGADRIAKVLTKQGIDAAAIHGDKSQNARERALHRFRSGVTRVLVATDIAARGIDVQGVSHVINFDLPNEPESYVHRIGRTGRAGATGRAISFCASEEQKQLRDIERLIKRRLPVAS